VRVTVPSFAKLNLDLRVLDKRSDGFHEVRTVFQTISLKDSLTIEFDFAKRTQIDLASSIEIADNLVVRAAKLVLEQLKVKAWVRFALDKQIPMGAGLGGGSSNAAAVLLALPALAGKPLPLAELVRLGGILGSDVPFFLFGGTMLGLGRGTELYALPDQPAHHVLVVSTGVHVSTPEAYRSLGRNVTDALTSPANSPMLREFQTVVWAMEPRSPGHATLEQLPLENDFEKVVFKLHPELAAVVRKLRRLGAKPAMMTGSGSAIFGVFSSASELQAAAKQFAAARAFPVRFVNRQQYRNRWLRALGAAAPASSFAR
jgi:4-diphosphocytidyl-2-C-methyl-D-erythritol kinase